MKFITLSCILSGNKPPKDHSVERQEFMMIPLPLMIIMWLMAAVGIVCSLGFLHFNISNGKSRYDIYRRDILIYARQQKRICLEEMSKVFKTSDIRCLLVENTPLITFDRKVKSACIKSPQFKSMIFHMFTCILHHLRVYYELTK